MMNTYEYKQAVEQAVKAGNYHEAFRLLRVMLPAGAAGLRQSLEAAREDYMRLMDFAMTGTPDPGRPAQLTALNTRIYGILDMLLRESLVPEHSSLYFNVVRTLRLRKGETLEGLLGEYSATARELSSFGGARLSKFDAEGRRRNLESLEERIFDRLWTTTPLTFDEQAAVRRLMADDATTGALRGIVVGALTMSLLQFFNEQTLLLLLDFAAPEFPEQTRARATVGAVLVMARWPRRSDSAAVERRLAALREQGSWSQDVEQTLLQVIRTADVEKIARTMRDEIIPQMMKLRPDLEKHLKESGFDPTEIDANPEWEELMEKSGLTERLRKFSEMNLEGGDLFYAAFSMMKGFPFFSHISHWFRPFDTENLDVARALGHETALGMLLEDSTAMCDSDKYSFTLSLDRLPEQQKQLLTSQIEQANVQMAELAGSELLPERRRFEGLIRGYVQDLYRFFNLFRRNAEFVNPFKDLVNPAEIPALRVDFADPERIVLLGEFYFKHGHFSQALELFRMIEAPDVALLQKMGHALQRLGRYEEALTEYERAELLAPDSEWTLRKLAAVNKLLGRHKKALEYYDRLETLSPDSPDTALNMGYCHIHLNEIREALHCCYKAEMLDEKSLKPLRAIAWCSFLAKDFDTARKYYERIFRETALTPEDYLNMGHLELASGNLREAMNYYLLYSPDIEKLAAALADDRETLARADIDTSTIPLILDALRFKND